MTTIARIRTHLVLRRHYFRFLSPPYSPCRHITSTALCLASLVNVIGHPAARSKLPHITQQHTRIMAADLSSLLNASKALTSHLSRPDLPSVNLSLDQIEAQSRRLVSRQPGTSADTSRAYVLRFPVVKYVHKFVRNPGIIYSHKLTLMHRHLPTRSPTSILKPPSRHSRLFKIPTLQATCVMHTNRT